MPCGKWATVQDEDTNEDEVDYDDDLNLVKPKFAKSTSVQGNGKHLYTLIMSLYRYWFKKLTGSLL